LIIGTKKSINDEVTWQGRCALSANPFIAINAITPLLTSEKFTGIVTIWNADNTLSNKCEYSQGSEYKTAYFYNKKKEVTKQDEFKDNKIFRTVTFKQNGEEKIKIY
jgi:hypothetical protein